LSESGILILTYALHRYVAHNLSPHSITAVTVQITPSHAGNYQQYRADKGSDRACCIFFIESLLGYQKLHK